MENKKGKEYVDTILGAFGEVRQKYEGMDKIINLLDFEMSDLLHKLELCPRIHDLIVSVKNDTSLLTDLEIESDERLEDIKRYESKTGVANARKLEKAKVDYNRAIALHQSLLDSIELKMYMMDFKRNRVERRVVKTDKSELESVYKYVISKGGDITTTNLLSVREQTEAVANGIANRNYTPRVRTDIEVLTSVNSREQMIEIGFYGVEYDLEVSTEEQVES